MTREAEVRMLHFVQADLVSRFGRSFVFVCIYFIFYSTENNITVDYIKYMMNI
jgi:hypothetical protein